MKLILERINSKVAFKSTNEFGTAVQIDGSESAGGEGLGLRPMELLATSLASCLSIDILLILKKMRIEPIKYEVHIQSKRKDAVPSSFESIHLTFVVDKNDPREKIEKAIQLSLDKYCSVAASLSNEIKISFDVITPKKL